MRGSQNFKKYFHPKAPQYETEEMATENEKLLCKIKYYPRKANMVTNTLSQKSQVKNIGSSMEIDT